MAFNLGNLAQFGLGFTKGHDQAEEKKKKDRQQLLVMTSRALQAHQAEQGRQAALAQRGLDADARRTSAAVIAGAKAHQAEATGALQREKYAHQKETTDAGLRVRQQALQIRGLGEYATNAGNGRYANMTPAQQAAAIQALNTTAGTSLPVPGAPDGGTRPKNYGLPPAQAGGVNAAIDLFGGETPTTPTTVPVFRPNADQTGKRQAVAATTARAQEATQEAPQRLAETGRHNRVAEGTARAGQGERSRHDGIAESQGAARIDQGMMRVLQGGQRVQQGGERLLQSGQRAGGKAGAYRDPVEQIERRLSELTKRGKTSARDALLGFRPSALVDTPEGHQEFLHLQNQRRHLQSQPVGPDGARVEPFPGVAPRAFRPASRAGVVAPYAPALPQTSAPPRRGPLSPAQLAGLRNAAGAPMVNGWPAGDPRGAPPVHHSHSQPRRQTGEFKEGPALGRAAPSTGHRPQAARSATAAALARLRALGIH